MTKIKQNLGYAQFINMKIVDKILQLFCMHDYQMLPEVDDEKERNEILSSLKEGESVAFVRLHRCTKCDKEKMLGSGIMHF